MELAFGAVLAEPAPGRRLESKGVCWLRPLVVERESSPAATIVPTADLPARGVDTVICGTVSRPNVRSKTSVDTDLLASKPAPMAAS